MDAPTALATALQNPTGPALLVAAGLLVRVTLAFETCAHGLLPTVDLKTRLALGLIVTLAALPTALVASPLASAGIGLTLALGVIAGEACLGLCLGLAVAAAVSAVAWAGDLLGSIAGLAWEDGEEDGAAGSPAGIARLARWLAVGGFLAAGGLDVVLVSLTDSVRSMPIGFLAGSAMPWPAIEAWALRMPALAFGLAVSLAVPTVAAVLVFQLAAAIALRTASCDPGPGFLHAATALVVLAMILVNAGAWSLSAGPRLLPSLAASLAPPAHAPSPAVPPTGSGGRP